MRGLLLVALGVFVLFLLVSGRLARLPGAWGFLVDGAFGGTDYLAGPLLSGGGGGAAVGQMQGIGGALGRVGGAVSRATGGTLGAPAPTFPRAPAAGAPKAPAAAGGLGGLLGRWGIDMRTPAGRTAADTASPPMTRP